MVRVLLTPDIVCAGLQVHCREFQDPRHPTRLLELPDKPLLHVRTLFHCSVIDQCLEDATKLNINSVAYIVCCVRCVRVQWRLYECCTM
jgi:hypothetical protein